MRPKKQHIYATAAQLFRERGYQAASMRELAQRVQLQASSLYSHIGGKEEILQHICFKNAKAFGAGMSEIEQLTVSPTEKIKLLIQLHIQIATEDTTSITVFNDEWRHLSEPYLTKFLQLRKDYETRFLAIIEQGIQAGEFKNIDANITLNTILSSLRWLHDWKADNNNSLENTILQISNLLLTGISKV